MEGGSAKPLGCPECGSERLCKDGIRYLKDNKTIQRWLCKECGRRFSETSLNDSNQPQHVQKIHTQILNSPNTLTTNCQWSHEAQNRAPTGLSKLVQTLAEVEKPSKNGQAGATEISTSKPITGKILEYAWWLKKEGYAESTITGRVKLLRRLLKLGADLYDPESVKSTIAKQESWSTGRKELAAEAYSSFLTMIGGKWNPPKYRRVSKLPFIPQESELDQLIGCFGTKMAALLQLLKETGMRLGEVVNLKWGDIDFETGAVRVTPEKGSNPRVFRLSGNLLAMLRKIQSSAESVKLFPSKSCVEAYFYRKRRQIAAKLCNPRLLQISFHTFRHWKATMEYAKTKDILHVMKMLGHKNIHNTLVYTQLVDFKHEEYVCKAVKDSDEASMLVETGFEYVCTTPDGVMLFRKRK